MAGTELYELEGKYVLVSPSINYIIITDRQCVLLLVALQAFQHNSRIHLLLHCCHHFKLRNSLYC